MKKNNFNVIRLLAAFMVMTGHMYLLVGSSAPVLCFSPVQGVGIKTFFCVGGYLITESWKREPRYGSFLLKRIFRIFPALLVYVLFTAYIIGPIFTILPLGEYLRHPLTFQYLENAALHISFALPGVFEGNPYPNVMNGSLWSLPVEVLMYLLIPVLYEVGKRGKGSVHIGVTACVCAMAMYKRLVYPEWDYVFYRISFSQALEVIPYYFLGSLTATKNFSRLWNLQTACVLAFAAQCVMTLVPEWAGYVCSYILIPYMVFSFAFCAAPIGECRMLKKYELSYGIYLYGFCVQQCVIALLWGKTTESVMTIFLISVAVTVGLALVSERLIEKPALRLKKSLLQLL